MNFKFNLNFKRNFNLAISKVIVASLLLISLLAYVGTVEAKSRKTRQTSNQAPIISSDKASETPKPPETNEPIPDQTPQAPQITMASPLSSGSKQTTNNTTITSTNTESTQPTQNQTPISPIISNQPSTIVPSESSDISQIVAAINTNRTTAGLSSVVVNTILNQAAYAKSKDMSDRNYFAHTAPDGTTDLDFIKNAGYKYSAVGINLAEGDFGSNQGVVDAWMNSAGHKANILADYGQEIGIGICGQYYTMIIGKPLK